MCIYIYTHMVLEPLSGFLQAGGEHVGVRRPSSQDYDACDTFLTIAIYLCICICVYIYIYIYIYICIHLSIYISICMCIYIYTYVYMHTCIHCVYIYIYIYIYIYTHMRSGSRRRSRSPVRSARFGQSSWLRPLRERAILLSVAVMLNVDSYLLYIILL